VMTVENYRSKLFAPLLDIINGEGFRKVVDNVGGYDTSQMGSTTLC